uniref:Coiled-coil domain containing 12 n=1 Tax=Pavo cristatus TaxID=9049 RepID=A0A8C9EPT0_PAVCR
MAAPGGGSVEDEEAEPVLGRLEEEARRRQERLRALRQRALQVGGGGAGERLGSGIRPVEVEKLLKRKAPSFLLAMEDKVKDQLEAAKPETIIDEVDLTNLAPRKPDWDLKRDVAKKMEKLEKRTQRAIAELIRERLKGQEEDLAAAVGSAKQDGSDSD